MRGYTSRALVADELGRVLTVGQQVQCDGLIGEAEAYVDRVTGRAWLTTSPVADELHTLVSPLVYLAKTPVASVTAVATRSPAIGSVWTALAAGSGYELLDPATGALTVSGFGSGDVVINTTTAGVEGMLLRVSYTHASPYPVPGDVQRAATLLVAAWMLPRLDPSRAGVASVSVGQGDLDVRYRDDQDPQRPVPPLVDRILAGYRGVVLA